MYYFPKIESCRVISILTNISLTGLKLCQNFKLSILSVKTYFLLKKKISHCLSFCQFCLVLLIIYPSGDSVIVLQ